MHLHVIICFALLIWWPEEPPGAPLITSLLWTPVVVWAQPPAFFLASAGAAWAALRRLDGAAGGPQRAQLFYHRSTMVLRLLVTGGFVAVLLATDWVAIVRSVEAVSAVPGLAGVVTALPFFGSAAMIFLGAYPIDRALHQLILDSRAGKTAPGATVWNRCRYLSFNLRHHLLVVAVPMVLILAAFDLSRANEDILNRLFQVSWAAEVAPAGAAALIFVIAPVMLRYIWPTKRLADGPLRRRLESISREIRFRYREILVWQSGRMMINAAVMGLFAPVRYVLLSDGLLEGMSRQQIEAVFGHEVGHVRQGHIPFFLLFAVCSMLLLSGIIEALRLAVERGLFELSVLTIQAIGFICILVVWGVGFGWLSRRFERQADLFGTRCVTPPTAEGCHLPCNAHPDPSVQPPAGAVCATAAAVFASALDRVALLNGIPREERSWRHGTILGRARFLTSLTGDPTRARRFERLLRRVKATLAVLAIVGTVIAGLYTWNHPLYGVGVGVEPAEHTAAVQPVTGSTLRENSDVRTDH
jgi:STE24 endopeptidase